MSESGVPSRWRGIMAHDQNPFWSSTKVDTKGKRITVESGAYITEDGERIEAGGIFTVQKVDRAQFVKLYTAEMRAIFELKPTAMKVIQYLIAEIQKTPNVDGVYLHWFSAEKYFSEHTLKVSRSAFKNAMRELMEKQIIGPSTQPNLFHINPKFFWNGDRYRFVRDYILEG